MQLLLLLDSGLRTTFGGTWLPVKVYISVKYIVVFSVICHQRQKHEKVLSAILFAKDNVKV